MRSLFTRLPQGPSLDEYRNEMVLLRRMREILIFLNHRSVEISLFFFHFLFVRLLARLSSGVLGGQMIVSEPLGGMAPLPPPLDPPVLKREQISIYLKQRFQGFIEHFSAIEEIKNCSFSRNLFELRRQGYLSIHSKKEELSAAVLKESRYRF